MPYSAAYKEDGAEFRFHGHTTGRDILQAKRELFGYTFPREARWSLCDFTAVEKLDVLPTEVKSIVRQDVAAVSTHPNLGEIVIAADDYQFGLARMWEMQVDSVRPWILVARSRDEAVRWLEGRGLRI